MTTNYIIAPNGRWSARNLVGEAAINGIVYTYQNQTRIPKTTYQDPAGLTPNTNPIRLDSKGEANIYWATDEFYTIEIYQYNEASGNWSQLVYSQDNYPATVGGAGGDVTINQAFPNLMRNPQFTLWGNGFDQLQVDPYDDFTRLGTREFICQDWEFLRSNTNSTIRVSKENFILGQTDVPGNPIHYLHYECSGIGAGGETFKIFRQYFTSVTTLSNTQISGGIWARSSSNSLVRLSFTQYFGSGGSPSGQGETNIAFATLTPDWQQITGTITTPSIAGKTLGTNNDDYVAINIAVPLNETANIDFCNVQLHATPTLPDFAYLPYNSQQKLTDHNVTQSTFVTGDFKLSIRPFSTNSPTAVNAGWVPCSDGTIGNYFSNANTVADNSALYLFIYLWNFSDALVPIYTSAGAASTRGATAMDDWNADKRLSLTRTLGRALAAAGTGAGLTTHEAASFTGTETVTLLPTNLPPHPHETFNLGTGAVIGNTTNGNVASVSNRTGDGSTLGLNSTPVNIIQPTLYVYCYIKL